ncbi:MAG TPA: DUF1289 domain-containing protein [Planctomycetota bacterium]
MSGGEQPPRERTEPPRLPGVQSGGVASPCILVCVMGARGLCRGCKRTLREIARWPSMSDDEKRAVLAALPARAPGA